MFTNPRFVETKFVASSDVRGPTYDLYENLVPVGAKAS